MIHNPEIFNSWQIVLEHVLDPKRIISKEIQLEYFFDQHKKNYALIAVGKGSSVFAYAIFDKYYKTNSYICLDSYKHFPDPKILVCDHPLPSKKNRLNSQKLIKFIASLNTNMPVVTVICGGSSAMLVKPLNSLAKTIAFNEASLKSGMPISQINTVRKHSDLLKGGNLAKLYYPRKSLNLYISDVDDDDISVIGSGPTAMDTSSIEDARFILEQLKISDFLLAETPKDREIFSNTSNVLLFNRREMVEGIKKSTRHKKVLCDYKILSNTPKNSLKNIFNLLEKNYSLYLFSGEPQIRIKSKGIGGRCAHMALSFLKECEDKPSYNIISFATDGSDNSKYAGVAFSTQRLLLKTSTPEISKYLNKFDSYTFFKKYKCIVKTGPLPVNVSDLMIIEKN